MRLTLLVLLGATAAACGLGEPYAALPFSVGGASEGSVDGRLLLVGDAGDANPDGEPVLDALAAEAARLPARTTVVFLGDNVYETGMPEHSAVEGTPVEEILDETLLNLYESRRDAERRVKAQVRVLRESGARGIFVPGNHDWDQFGIGGWARIREQERYLASLATPGTDVRMLPGGGCPGPALVDVGRRTRLVVLDTQWWLDDGEKPGVGDNPTGCHELTEDAVVAALERAFADAATAGRCVVVVAHHPLRSLGPHGGWIDPRWHLFPMLMLGSYVPVWVRWSPMPVLGSLMGFARHCCSPNAQDFAAAANRHMRVRLRRVMVEAAQGGAAPLLYASGHEHSLQLFRGTGGARFLLVSGRGSSEKVSPVGHDRTTLFADSGRPGFARVDVLRDGDTRLAILEVEPDGDRGIEVFSRWLQPSASERP